MTWVLPSTSSLNSLLLEASCGFGALAADSRRFPMQKGWEAFGKGGKQQRAGWDGCSVLLAPACACPWALETNSLQCPQVLSAGVRGALRQPL